MKILVTGGAGFIGSHLCDRLLARGDEVHALDNLSLGRRENVAHNLDHRAFRFIEADLLEIEPLRALFEAERYDAVFHLAANSDIERSARETDLDLRLTFLTTCNVAECARRFGVGEVLFASSSTVYGPHDRPLSERTGPFLPASLYGAAKLAAEGFLSAYASMFDLSVWILRLPNVVGERMTHGCVYDFINRLHEDPSRLVILGDGGQRKPYVHVEDVLDAVLLAWECSRDRINCFNIGTDSATSVSDIARIVIEEMGLRDVCLEYTGGEGGWPGDVPRFQYDSSKIHALGWRARHISDEAIRAAVRATVKGEAAAGK
ncbi:epimerase [candidate division BRC1 bacterium SM23_51]|nr:MAG: epimerase [candidate division BRC1 bacterium SM23_51]